MSAIPSSLLTPIGPLDPKREKQLCRTVHFVDRGEAVLVTYLESHAVYESLTLPSLSANLQ